MSKIVRNLSTPEAREFWRRCEESAKEVKTWPDWMKAGIVSGPNEPMWGNSL